MTAFAQRILVIKHGALGDLVQSDGILRDIRQHYRHAEIVLLTSLSYQMMMQRCPYVDRIITDPRAPLWHLRQQFGLLNRLRNTEFDQVIDLQNSSRSRLYRQLFFPDLPWIGRLTAEPEPESGLKGQVALLKKAGIPINHAFYPDVSWLAEDVTELLSEDNVETPFVALIPGCSAQHPEKRWPFYPQLAKALIANGYDVVNIIGPDELNLVNTLPGHCLVNRFGLLSWFQMAGILQQASYVVGNDTGPSHIASCLNKPGLALFGPHTSVARAEIQRGRFGALKVNDLHQLSVDTVLSYILSKQPAPTPLPATPMLLSNY